jgi:hypothetical protein
MPPADDLLATIARKSAHSAMLDEYDPGAPAVVPVPYRAAGEQGEPVQLQLPSKSVSGLDIE